MDYDIQTLLYSALIRSSDKKSMYVLYHTALLQKSIKFTFWQTQLNHTSVSVSQQ